MLLSTLQGIPDHRRPQGRMYDLPHLLLFSIFAVASGADSYRTIHTFIKIHLKTLQGSFPITWKKAPAYGTIRYAIQRVDPTELEQAFREHAKLLTSSDSHTDCVVSLDGKTIKGSFDNFNDKKAIHVLNALLHNKHIILAHELVETEKTNEIPVAQKLITELGLERCIFTMDALHTQKKLSREPKTQTMKQSYR